MLHIVKKTCSFQLQVCLLIYDHLVQLGIKFLKQHSELSGRMQVATKHLKQWKSREHTSLGNVLMKFPATSSNANFLHCRRP